MRNLASILAAFIIVLTAGYGRAPAADYDAAKDGIEKSAYASIGGFTNYVWRGQKLSEKPVLQPAAGITYGGFGAGLWANYDIDREEHTETDLTLSYSHVFGPLTLGGGYIYYALNGANDTSEVYLSVASDVLMNPTLTYYHDFVEGEGGCLVAAVGHELQLGHEIKLRPGASVSMNFQNGVLGTDKNGEKITGFHNGELNATLTIPVYKEISLIGLIAYSFPLGKDAKEAIKAVSFDQDDDIMYGGLTISVNF